MTTIAIKKAKTKTTETSNGFLKENLLESSSCKNTESSLCAWGLFLLVADGFSCSAMSSRKIFSSIYKSIMHQRYKIYNLRWGSSRFNTEGTGLGLYVARQIVHEHHGEVSVTSDGKDKGSSFFMRIPIEGSPSSLRLEDNK